MKKLLLTTMGAMVLATGANAANVTLYYSPTCPHCHHARDFIGGELVYEYKDIKADAVNVADAANRPEFNDVMKKCNYDFAGVPVIVIGDKCFQGYDARMDGDLRDAIEADMSDDQKNDAAANRGAMATDREGYKSQNAERANALVERGAADQKKTDGKSLTYLYVLLGVLVVGLGFVLLRKKK